MNKRFYKRIIGLFIFTLTFMLLNIIDVNAITCSEAKDNETMLARYGLKMDYDESTGEYKIISAFNDKETGGSEYFKGFDLNKIKFKVTGVYFYTPYEPPVKLDDEGLPIRDKDGNPVLDTSDPSANVTDADNIKEVKASYVEDASSRLSGLVSSGVISKSTLNRKDSITIKTRNENNANPDIFDVRSDSSKYGLAFKLVPDGFSDPVISTTCKEKSTFFAIVYIAYENAYEETDEDHETDDFEGINTGFSTEWVDCNKNYPKGSFAYNFCVDKIASVGADGTDKKSGTRKFTIKKENNSMIKYEDGKKKIELGDLTYKCDYKVSQTSTESTGYYVNKNYLYGEGDKVIDLGGYQYSGEYAKPTSSLKATCTIHCEEVVKVEYGPPVASKAGLCFEYKVKVTSRVNCKSAAGPTKPPKQVVCTPTPYCKHKGGKIWNVAGPNENFDKCVVSCDGGVYSDKCVNKCYKKVYGKSIVRQTTGYEIAYEDVIQTGISNDIHYVYKKDSDGNIYWDVNNKRTRKKGKSKSDYGGTNRGGYGAVKTDSWWHKRHTWGINSSLYNLYDTSTGIPEKVGCKYSDCWWKKNTKGACGKAENARYLNTPKIYKAENRIDGDKSYKYDDKIIYDRYTYDKIQNENKYKELVKQCNAYASCNTTTAEFTISASYTEKGKTTKQTINFPYTENNDKNAKDTIKNNDTTTTCPTNNASTTILSSAGCYNCSSNGIDTGDTEKDNDGKKKMYMTEWSFPGTWIHNKTGKISYKPVSTGAWRKIKEKFCLPLNVANTNAEWYNYYQTQINGSDTSYTYNNPDYIRNIQCPDGTEVKTVNKCQKTQFTSEEAKPISEGGKTDYNINASTRKFGWFEWDIDISCFYAINDLYPKINENDECFSLTCSSSEKYRIRSVDLGNLFPTKEGEDGSRNPGFNWTSFASQTAKDANYKSTPSNYATWIQAKGTDVYSDNYLDYEVNLTKEDISNIKKTVNGVLNKNYTDWQGETEVNSVVNYKSTLIRQTLTNTKYPGEEALKCNNIGDHTPAKNYSARCEEFSNKEGK